MTSLNSKCELIMHLRTHSDKPYMCFFCDEAYSDHKDLLLHLATHSGPRSCKCNLCDLEHASNSMSTKTWMSMHTRSNILCAIHVEILLQHN